MRSLPLESPAPVILLARLQGLPFKEIATNDALGECVKNLPLRALKSLRESLGNTERPGLPDRQLEAEGGSHGG